MGLAAGVAAALVSDSATVGTLASALMGRWRRARSSRPCGIETLSIALRCAGASVVMGRSFAVA
jgi:hypothetical protein